MSLRRGRNFVPLRQKNIFRRKVKSNIMETRKLGQSDLEVTVLAFGAWAIGGWMWGGADTKEAIKAIETAVDNGMTN